MGLAAKLRSIVLEGHLRWDAPGTSHGIPSILLEMLENMQHKAAHLATERSTIPNGLITVRDRQECCGERSTDASQLRRIPSRSVCCR
jgi:hypothetical protein